MFFEAELFKIFWRPSCLRTLSTFTVCLLGNWTFGKQSKDELYSQPKTSMFMWFSCSIQSIRFNFRNPVPLCICGSCWFSRLSVRAGGINYSLLQVSCQPKASHQTSLMCYSHTSNEICICTYISAQCQTDVEYTQGVHAFKADLSQPPCQLLKKCMFTWLTIHPHAHNCLFIVFCCPLIKSLMCHGKEKASYWYLIT